ncbi:YeeE/YedE thiosulfate transporter family protein [Halorhodospira neutriphila]|uniref:Sulphur transport domain-containing protein n=1 Tax=Halorhodospira neutriphila TaxID=168379 RepID=A0ABS1E8I4_9GAMM|nr:YeeE/YedE thiosulfate transporter family protein [Halorhodospira neutriphila]MBK1727472.1 hypothetical protein [Halorhodospira neutriphila]
MAFESFAAARWALLGSIFLIAVLLGAVVNRTHFCTMGAVSDAVNMGDFRRLRAWLLAIAVAAAGVALLEPLGLIGAERTMPPYRSADFAWAGYLLGGLLFGVGMTLGGGCGNKVLVRLGAGNLKSLVVAAVLGVSAYYMTNPPPGLELPLRGLLFGWIDALAIELPHGQGLASLAAGEAAARVRPLIAAALCLGLLYAALRSAALRRSRGHLLGGAAVGAAVVAVLLISSNVWVVDDFGQRQDLQSYATNWSFHHPDSEAGRPESARLLAPQGLSFVGPVAQGAGYVGHGLDPALATIGVALAAGVIAGSFLAGLFSRSLRLEWFASRADLGNHLLGGLLMGVGGVLAMGCTFGQAITGAATLALSAPVTMLAILLGSALTMKVQYYRLLHEEEATLGKALLTGLVDLRLLPAAMRQLDAL